MEFNNDDINKYFEYMKNRNFLRNTIYEILLNMIIIFKHLGFTANIVDIDGDIYIWFPKGISGSYLEHLLVRRGMYNSNIDSIDLGYWDSIDTEFISELNDICVLVHEYNIKHKNEGTE